MTRVVAMAIVAIVMGYWLFGDTNIVLRSSDGKWADSEVLFKGRKFEILVWNFEAYKMRCSAPNAILLRATPERWYNVFAWPDYLTNYKWHVPYSDAHPEIGDYYPAVSAKNCYNLGTSMKDARQVDLNAARYLSRLK
jgi:hypothetical protein